MQLAQAIEPSRTTAVLADPVGVALTGLSARLQAHGLVEAADGGVVAHALHGNDAPAPLVTAVLQRNAGGLTSSLLRQRSSGLLPGGPLLSALLPDWDGVVQSAPLVRAGQRLGWLWLLPASELDVEVVAAAAAVVAAACPIGGGRDEDDEAVRAALDGKAPLPAALVESRPYACVLSVIGAPAADIRLALEACERAPRMLSVAAGERLQAVLLTATRPDSSELAQHLRDVVRDAGALLDLPLRAGLSEPGDATAPLGEAARQADAAVRVVAPGTCAAVRDVRTRVVLDHVRQSLLGLPDLGPDPVALLHAHDRRKGTDLGRTVRHWLDARGDVAAAALSLHVHPNTLRYRLKSAQAVAGTSFDDLSVQLELHLRLDT